MPHSNRSFAVFSVFVLFFVALFGGSVKAQVLTDYNAPEFAPPPAADLHLAAMEEIEGSYTGSNKASPVNISADSLMHDEQTQTIIARGNVELTQAGRSLRADEVMYNLETDTVVARGGVVLHEPNGTVSFADEVTLSDKMRNGFVKGLKIYLAEGGRFRAKEGVREGDTITMNDASYTPCDCDTDEDGDPAWQIKAKKVTYNEAENRISYRNARFEIFGVPVAWTPYLSHPDGQIKRKSGLLMPGFGYDSKLGVVVTPRYYWNIAPNKDATFGLMITNRERPVFLTEYRHRFAQADMVLDGSISHSGRVDSIAGEDVRRDEKLRGHLFADGLWNINHKWRAGLDLELTSDDQYLRQFDIRSKTLLENELYVERFSGRDYAVARALIFQDTRVGRVDIDQPNILPEITTSFYGEPNDMLGGRWSFDTSALGLSRDGSGQDVTRLVVQGGWQRRYVSNTGMVAVVDTSLRGDAYRTSDRDVALPGSGRSNTGTETRIFPRAHIVGSWPLVKEYEHSQLLVEPIASLTAAPDINVADSDIPNEDSQDVQIDASNLFEADRFPGKDRIEDGSHVTYGTRVGVYGHEGSHISAFVGQSYRLDKDSPFPEGSGLSGQDSDIVGQISGAYGSDYGINYRFQLGNADLSSQRHELDAFAAWGRFSLNTRYLFAKALAGTDISESREQIMTAGGYKVTKRWRLTGGTLFDLGQESGLRKATVGLDYTGCCISFSLAAKRTLTADSSGDSGTDIYFRIGLKGIGEFSKSNSGFSSLYNAQ